MSFGQSDAPAESPPFPGVDPNEWHDLLVRGEAAGVLDAEEITHVLRTVELTGDVLEGVQQGDFGPQHPHRRSRRRIDR